ncbi:MAG: hypothetical protein U0R71_00800 [Solirubrobacterales bacterium]
MLLFRGMIACGLMALAALTAVLGVDRAEAACGPTGGLTANPEGCEPSTAAGGTAKLVEGLAIAPAGAPAAVRKVIDAANRIRTKPYLWGGGHRRWWDRGYDCSGAVSYALRGAGLLSTPLDSSGLMDWGAARAGRWITVYANAGHTYAVIAGLRWDTAGSARGTGPRWYPNTRSVVAGRFAVRHPAGY